MDLPEDRVHVWHAGLGISCPRYEALERFLSEEECARAARFHFERDRRRYVAARGILRCILAGYLGDSPERLRFRYNPFGKPYLEYPGGSTIAFNVSHSQDAALFAFTRHRATGVDIEQIRRDWDLVALARNTFSEAEVATLRSLPAELLPLAFFCCWTRKEAFIKAKGQGLSFPLDRFAVSCVPGEPARLLATADDPGEAGRWSLEGLEAGQTFAAALAVEGHGWHLCELQWTDFQDGMVPCSS